MNSICQFDNRFIAMNQIHIKNQTKIIYFAYMNIYLDFLCLDFYELIG